MPRKKVITLVLLLVLFLLTGFSIYLFNNLNQESQTTQTRASEGGGAIAVSCKNQQVNIQVSVVSQDPAACEMITQARNGKLEPIAGKENQKTPTRAFSMTVNLKNNDTVARKITYWTLENVCPEPAGTYFKSPAGREFPVCTQNARIATKDITLQPGQSQLVTITSTSYAQTACGSYQNDFGIVAIDNDINCGLAAPYDVYGVGRQCHTGVQCTEPAPQQTPGPVASCQSMTYTSGASTITVNSPTSANTVQGIPEPGTKVQLTSTGVNADSRFSGYWIKPKDAAWEICNFWIASADSSARFSGPGTMEFTMPDWKNGTLIRNDSFAGQCSGKTLDFSKGVLFGTNYVVANGTGSGQWCANAGPLPSTPGAINGDQSKTCTNPCVVQINPGTVEPTRTPSADTPPSMTLGGPGKTCYEQSKVITVKGDPGSRTDSITYQVYAVKDNRSEWAAGECPSGQRDGQYCLLGENTQRLFNVDTGTLPIGTYVFFAQVVAPDQTVLCSNDIIKENPVKCSRVCL
jgi:hypothetical protein